MNHRRRQPWTSRVALRPLRLLPVLLAACDSASLTPLPMDKPADGGVDASAPVDAAPARTGALGLNDVTVLIPLADPGGPTLFMASDVGSDGNQLLSRATYDRLNNIPKRGPVASQDDLYPLLQVVAVRFDLCDRIAPGPCPDEDGRMRLVLQAQYPKTGFGPIDSGLHLFFTIPKADFPGLVTELRTLGAIQALPDSAPLQPSPTLMKSISGEYAKRLRALMGRYALQNSLTRITFLGSRDRTATATWVFRGIERTDAGFVDIQIPGIASTLQDATLGGSTASFDVVPATDTPKGFALAIDEIDFATATAPQQTDALVALNIVDNPLMTTTANVACVTCHISGRVVGPREKVATEDSRKLPNRYTSSTFDLSVPLALKGSLRALGWAHKAPLIAQRVANDSAEVATEMNARFPP